MIKKIKLLLFTLLFIFPLNVLAQYPIVKGASSVTGESPLLPIFKTAKQGIILVLGAVGILAICGLVLALILYLTAAGDEDRIGDGAKIFKTSMLQIFIVVFGLTIIFLAQKILGGGGYF